MDKELAELILSQGYQAAKQLGDRILKIQLKRQEEVVDVEDEELSGPGVGAESGVHVEPEKQKAEESKHFEFTVLTFMFDMN